MATMFKIEETDERDTFRIRSTENPKIVFEVSALTKEAAYALPELIGTLELLDNGRGRDFIKK